VTALAEVAPESTAELLFRRVAGSEPAPRASGLRVVHNVVPGVGHNVVPGVVHDVVQGGVQDTARNVVRGVERGAVRPEVPGAARERPSDAAAPVAGAAERPRVRLVPAPPPARVPTATTPAGGPPPALAERLRVLKADDRSLDPDDADEPRGEAPAEDPTLVVRRLAGASVEVIVGRRPAAQLARWLAPGVLDALRARAAVTRGAVPSLTRAPAVRGVRVCTLHEHLVEATAVVDDGRRVRAIALRLESHRGAWRATALEVG
jgi:hypothetical protein